MKWICMIRKSALISLVLMGVLLALGAGRLCAEPVGPYNVGFNLNFPAAAGDTTGVLKNGFGFGLDLGYRPESSPLGLRMDIIHGSFDLTSAVLNKINFADAGWASYWGFDLSAVLTPRNARKIRPYL